LSTTINSWFTLKVNEDGSLIAQPRTGTNKPEVDVSLNRKHEGDGETSREQSLTNKISGEVVQVLPNGQMLIAARTRIRVSGEDESVELTGRVDPRDLDSDSSLDADKIIDLRYKVTGKGDITDATKRGWLAKVIDKVNPF
jgi:flagellar L-ring protein precursor FlgH